MREADVDIAHEPATPITPFATLLRLRTPQGVRVDLRPELVKSLIDGVVAGFQAHRDRTTLGEISRRVGATLGMESDRIAQLLLDPGPAVLGVVNRLVHLRGAGVIWNPSDHMCVAGEVLVEDSTGPDWRLDGQLWAVEAR